MKLGYQPKGGTKSHEPIEGWRVGFVMFGVIGLCLLIIGRLFQIQVIQHKTWQTLASDQHEMERSLVPARGTVYVQDSHDGQIYAVAKDRPAWLVYGVPREVKNATTTSEEVGALLNIPADQILAKIGHSTGSYAMLAKDVSYETVQTIRDKAWPGIGVSQGATRWYPEQGIGGQFLGFVSTGDDNQRSGKYGVEGFYNDILAGEPGHLITDKDAAGRRIAVGSLELQKARDGSDIVLTIDRNIQYEACKQIQQTVKEHEATQGTVIIMEPQTGAILAMCSTPDFDSGTYNKVLDVGIFNNPATYAAYEPGSIFKPLTMAAGIDQGKIMPDTTFNDTGSVVIDDFTIRDSDHQAHGITTMNKVLEQSLNLGTIFVQQQIGLKVFRDYVKRFGFGVKTNVGLNTEGSGDIANLDRPGKVFGATASFGQGITVTPIQILTAIGAIANHGKLMHPYIVQRINNPDGSHVDTKPEVQRQVVSDRATQLVSGMMVNVVENGHGKAARVPGYFVAGKTGTAQVSNPKGGYLEGVTIGSFVGFAPADHPRFVMLVKIDRPKDAAYAETVAAPVFGRLSKYLLNYFAVAPERPINAKDLEPVQNTVTSSSAPSVAGDDIVQLAPAGAAADRAVVTTSTAQ